jgi:hypothetical protein
MWKNKIKKAKQAEPGIFEDLNHDGGNNGHDQDGNLLMGNLDGDDHHDGHDEDADEDDDDDLGLLTGKRSRAESDETDRRDSNDQMMKRGRGDSHDEFYAVSPVSSPPQPPPPHHQQQQPQQQQQSESLSSQPVHYQFETRNTKASKRDQNWDLQFDSLLAYATKHKHCNVRTGYTVNDEDKPHVNLYAWLALQRRHKKQNKLRPDREKKLQTLVDAGLLSWAGSEPAQRSGEDEEEYIHVLPPPPPPSWESHFHQLLIYSELHGHANVPFGYLVTVDKRKDVDLGVWLDEQRKQNRQKQSDETLTNISKLNILADEGRFSWTTPRTTPAVSPQVLDMKWSARYEAFRSFIAQESNHAIGLSDNIKANLVVPIPDGSVGGGSVEVFDLGLWILAQRKCYAAGVLDERRKSLLQALVDADEFTWQSKEESARISAEEAKRAKEEEALWNAWYNALVWQGNHVGHCNLDSHGTITLPDGSEAELGKWLHIQRVHIKKGRLRLDRAKKIKNLFDEGKLHESKWGHVFTMTYPPGSFDETPPDADAVPAPQAEASPSTTPSS